MDLRGSKSASAHLHANRLQVTLDTTIGQVAAIGRAFAGRAGNGGRRHQLAQSYDEVCRKEWCQRAARGKCLSYGMQLAPPHVQYVPALQGDDDFDINLLCLKQDPELLQQAEDSYDAIYGPPAKQSKGGAQSTAKSNYDAQPSHQGGIKRKFGNSAPKGGKGKGKGKGGDGNHKRHKSDGYSNWGSYGNSGYGNRW